MRISVVLVFLVGNSSRYSAPLQQPCPASTPLHSAAPFSPARRYTPHAYLQVEPSLCLLLLAGRQAAQRAWCELGSGCWDTNL